MSGSGFASGSRENRITPELWTEPEQGPGQVDLGTERIEPERDEGGLPAGRLRAREREVDPQLPVAAILADRLPETPARLGEAVLCELRFSRHLPRIRGPGHPRHRLARIRLGFAPAVSVRRGRARRERIVADRGDERESGDDENKG